MHAIAHQSNRACCVGVQEPRFSGILGSMVTEQQGARIGAALTTLI